MKNLNTNITELEAIVLRTFLPKQSVEDFGQGFYPKMNFNNGYI